MNRITTHLAKVAAWGLLTVFIWYVICQITVIQVMGRHRFKIPGLDALDWIYKVITLPCCWIRPGSPFDNWLPSLTIMALFWGVFIHGVMVVLKKRKSIE